MADKKIVEQFTGEIPRAPDKDLPPNSASLAVNTRLTNGEIRPYPQVADSTDTNSELSLIVSGGYTNFFKASNEDAINWMSWVSNDRISTLEVRYNDISAYDFPEPPRTNVQEGEQLAVGFTGLYVSNKGSGAVESWVAAFTDGKFESGITPGQSYTFTQEVTAVLVTEIDPISTYLWEYVSGAQDILPVGGSSIANPEFSTTLIYPSVEGIENGLTKSAIWRCTVTDTGGNVGTKTINVSFTAYLFVAGGGGGDVPGNDGGIIEWDEK